MAQLPPIARSVVRYLLEHPNARDTVDGLTEWWLLGRSVVETRQEVQAAVELLVDFGVLECESRGGRVLYGLAPGAAQTATDLLAKD